MSESSTLPPSELQTSPPLLAVAEQVARDLVVQPAPDALGVAQAALLPLLWACGQRAFDLRVLRAEGLPTSRHLRYRLHVAGAAVPVDVWAVGEPIDGPRAAALGLDGAPWGLRLNGPQWCLLDAEHEDEPAEFSLFDEVFPTLLPTLIGRGDASTSARLEAARELLREGRIAARLERLVAELGLDVVRAAAGGPDEADAVAQLLVRHGLLAADELAELPPDAFRAALAQHLRATEMGLVRPAPPLAHVAADDVRRHADKVASLRGGLVVRFDGEEVPVYSRSGYYFVLAALALQFGREDAIPARDLVRPPQAPPADRRSRPLGRAGWHLLLDGDLASTSAAVGGLLERLRLTDRFEAVQNDQPYP